MRIPLGNDASVTMSVADFRKLEDDLTRLTEAAANARARPAQDIPQRIHDLEEALRLAAPIVGFAIGLLNPETYRHWPHSELERLAKLYGKLFDGDAFAQDAATTWAVFAQEAAAVDAERQRRYDAAKAILADELPDVPEDTSAPTDDTPLTSQGA